MGPSMFFSIFISEPTIYFQLYSFLVNSILFIIRLYNNLIYFVFLLSTCLICILKVVTFIEMTE